MTTSFAATPLAAAVGRFVPVPPDHADYSTDAVKGARALRLDPAQVASLASAGLPHVADAERGPLFDYVDLTNVAMFSGTGQSVPELALRYLTRFGAAPETAWYGPRDWLVTVRLHESADGSSLVLVRVPDMSADGVGTPPSPAAPRPATAPGDFASGGYQVAIRLTGRHQRVRHRGVLAVWADMLGSLVSGRILYQAVPESLRAAHGQAWRLGMADCIVVSRVMAERIRDLGVPARARRGYLLGLVGSDHAWCEVLDDGQWKQLDAVFAFIGSGVGRDRGLGLDAPAFVAASCGSRFNRLLPFTGEEAAPLAYFGDRPAPAWVLAGVSVAPWGRP
jgi:hypothetical protein